MTIVFSNTKNYNCLSKKPYSEFIKKYDELHDDIDGKGFEIKLKGIKESFIDGFYFNADCNEELSIGFEFWQINSLETKEKQWLISMKYSYKYENEKDLELHLRRVKSIERRMPYLYWPNIKSFEFYSPYCEEQIFRFNVVTADNTKETALFMLSYLIAIFCLDD